MDGPQEVPGDPGDAALRQTALEYERDNDNREYRRMARQGTLEGYLASKVRATRDYAGWLIKQNEMPSHAWRRAIRTLILEREED